MMVWKFLNSSLPCGQVLRQHHVPCQITCPFCKSEDESLDHLFRTCDFSEAVWFGILVSLRICEIEEPGIVTWLGKCCT